MTSFTASSASEDNDNDSEYQASSSEPNTSALETLVRTACESLAVSTLLAGSSSGAVDPLNVPGQQTPSKDPAVARPTGDTGACQVPSSSNVSNLFPTSTNALHQASSDDAVFSVIFGHSREQNVAEGTPEGQPGSLSSSKDLQESALDLAQDSLQDIEDVEVGENQRAKKVASDSLGLVDFAIGLLIFVLNLPNGQVLFFFFWGGGREFKLQKNCSQFC